MPSIVLRLDPTVLANPDADLRYALTELLVERSGGTLQDDGYDYGEGDVLEIYLVADNAPAAVTLIEQTLRDEVVLGNRLLGQGQ